MLSKLMSVYWWVLLLRGVLAILFGIAAYAWPGMTLATLVTLFGAFAFVDGIFNVFHALSGRKEDEHWWVLLLEGLLGIAFGVITFQAPEHHRDGADPLHRLLGHGDRRSPHHPCGTAAQGDRRGVVDGPGWACRYRLRRADVARPGAGALALLWLVAIWAIVGGVFLVILSFKVKGLGGRLDELKQKLAGRAKA